jgi:hypothetical protein
VFLALTSATAAAAEPTPSSIDPLLHTVASTGFHRFLEYRVCSPEHCWSNAFLQWFDTDAPERGVAATVKIGELGYGTAVESARWFWSGEQPRLEVRVVPSHGGFKPYTLIIKPGSPGQYTSARSSARAAQQGDEADRP